MIVILFVSVASGQSVEILFVFKSPFWTKKYKNVEFYRLKSLHFRYISKISKFRTKISDLGNFLYGICRFYAIYTKTTLTLQVQTKLSRKRELLGPRRPENLSPVVSLHIWVDWCHKESKTGKIQYNIFRQQKNVVRRRKYIMKNKTFACVMGLVLALSLTACGEEEVIVENTNEEVSVEVQTQEATEAPTETVAETGTEAEGGPLLQVAVMEIPDLSGTEWNFAGGMIDGVEMEEEDLNATLETYGGTLQLVFGEDGAVTMVQGGGNAEGTYEYSDDNTAIKMTLDFGGTEVTYAGFLSEVGDTVTLIAMSDMNGYDGLYFVQ